MISLTRATRPTSNWLGNYIEFTNLTGATQSISVAADLQFGPVGVNGFQINAIPEPSTWAMLLGGIGLLMVSRRFRA